MLVFGGYYSVKIPVHDDTNSLKKGDWGVHYSRQRVLIDTVLIEVQMHRNIRTRCRVREALKVNSAKTAPIEKRPNAYGYQNRTFRYG